MTTQRSEPPTGTAGDAEPAEPEARDARAPGSRRFRYTLPRRVGGAGVRVPGLHPVAAAPQRPAAGVVCGISAAIGYGVGVAGAWVWRAFADRDPRPPRPGA
jgi:uncharacterized membrane protein